MNISFNIERLIPGFLLADRNGYALAKAIEQAFRAAAEAAQEGLGIVLDVDKMPEWRLDEMAWELNCLYDYSADVEAKRQWIKNARKMNRILGTPEGVRQYLYGYFDQVDLLEAKDYQGDPFHFKADLYGVWSEKLQVWALSAILAAKNVRSVLDGVTFHLPEITGRNMRYVGTGLYSASRHALGTVELPDFDDVSICADGLGSLLMDGFGVILGL